MITGRWGRPSQVLLDITVDADGQITGLANPGSQNAVIDRGRFDAATGAVHLEGVLRPAVGDAMPRACASGETSSASRTGATSSSCSRTRPVN